MDTTTAGTDKVGSLFVDWVKMIYEYSKGADGKPMPVFAVMESVGPRPRHTVTIGDGMGTRMKMAGAEAFITNGCIRDIEGVREVGLPCWAAGLLTMHGRLRWLDVGSPVVIDGMTVRTGDYIHADINGAVLIPPDVADQAYDKAMEVRNMEGAMFAKLRTPGYTIEKWFAELGK
jgi:4-hydroxy-4-methyl-2-oxoglutarate aldolase